MQYAYRNATFVKSFDLALSVRHMAFDQRPSGNRIANDINTINDEHIL